MASPPIPAPKKVSVDDLKAKLLQPALTSHFECYFPMPEEVRKQLGYNGIFLNDDLLTISCSEASLPGSSIATHDLNNDFTGVTQKHAYRRIYDDRADFTFYVNRSYTQISVFEVWLRYIAGEQLSFGEQTNIHYRSPYPNQYKAKALYITKFERDYGPKITYTFVNVFPISIQSMPVSYDSSQLLKCTVSFTYDRYFVNNADKDTQPQAGSVGQNNLSGNPEVQALINANQFSVAPSNFPQTNLSGVNALTPTIPRSTTRQTVNELREMRLRSQNRSGTSVTPPLQGPPSPISNANPETMRLF